MSIDDSENPKLLQFIASTVEVIRDRLTGIENRLGGLEDRIGGLENRMGALENRVDAIENRMEAGFTAVRGDIERVHLRLDSIERMPSARVDRVETEVSRLRSVVYLLVKDRPDLLRLLGETSLS